MDRLLDFILCGGIVVLELFIIFIVLVLIQFIFYRVFKINLYKKTMKFIEKICK